MKLEFSFLAKALEIHPEGDFSVLGGGIQNIEVPEFPFTVPALNLLLRFGAEQAADAGQHRVAAELLGPDGASSVQGSASFLLLPGNGNGLPATTTLSLMIRDLTFHKSGMHQVRLIVDDTERGGIPFLVASAQDEERRTLAELSAVPQLSREHLMALAQKHKPPQSWYDENDELF